MDVKKLFIMMMTALFSLQGVLAQEKYITDKGFISFFSKAPITDVDARNQNVRVELNASNGELTFEMNMADFKFKSEKMGRDAEKKYLETKKYTKAGFIGKIEGKIDYEKPGKYNATAKGRLKIHGVEKNVTEKGTVTVGDNGQVKLESQFNVVLKDYNIETPEILGKKMTEDKVLIKVEATLAKK